MSDYISINEAHSNNGDLKRSGAQVFFAASLQWIIAAIVAAHAARSIVAGIRSRLQNMKRGRADGSLKTPDVESTIPEVDWIQTHRWMGVMLDMRRHRGQWHEAHGGMHGGLGGWGTAVPVNGWAAWPPAWLLPRLPAWHSWRAGTGPGRDRDGAGLRKGSETGGLSGSEISRAGRLLTPRFAKQSKDHWAR